MLCALVAVPVVGIVRHTACHSAKTALQCAGGLGFVEMDLAGWLAHWLFPRRRLFRGEVGPRCVRCSNLSILPLFQSEQELAEFVRTKRCAVHVKNASCHERAALASLVPGSLCHARKSQDLASERGTERYARQHGSISTSSHDNHAEGNAHVVQK
jgi:hypothetical protein